MAVPISNVTRRQVYAPSGAGGAGPYAFTFEILANTDIAVYKDDVLLTLTTHYTVTINANGTGSVTITAAGLALAPASPTQYAIVGNRTISRTTDFTTGGDFFANTLNDELDQQTIFAQQNAEGLQRALAAPQTDPTSINMTLPRAALRANKALGFDANGNPVISDTLGTNRGNWSAGVLYYARDIVKDTTNNNIWQCLVQHTSSGSQPINTNADSAKWSLLVDAASATTSATNAAASASAASTSASNASTSASNASTSASNASTSASNAASSASAASTSASNAAASYDSFDDRYLGPKSSAPSVDNDGNSLLTGALYWDTVINQMRVWSGTAWVNVNASASNTRTAITATAGQTVLTVATYTPGTNTMVLYVNGVKLNASEYTETNATTVTLTTGLALNDEVEVFSYRVNEIGTLGASSVTIADTGNYYTSGNVEGALQEAAQSSTTRFVPAVTGAVTRSVQDKVREFVSVKDFGVTGNGSTDDTALFQAAIDYCANNRRALYVPAGGYIISATLKIYANTVIVGERGERNFGPTLYWSTSAPSNGRMIDINGDLNDFGVSPDANPYAHQVHIEDLTIMHQTGSPDLLEGLRVRNAYNIIMRRLRFHNLRAADIIKLESEVNDMVMDRCIVYGGTPSSGAVNGLNCSGNAESTVTLIGCDFETCNNGVYVANGHINVLHCYFERNISQIYVFLPTATGKHFLNIKDCHIAVGSSSQNGINMYRGSNIRVEDCQFNINGTAADTNAIQITHNINNCVWQNTIIRGIHPKYIAGAGKTLVQVERPGLESGNVNVMRFYNNKTLADNVATTMFTVINVTSMAAFKLRIWANMAGYGRSYKEFVFTVTRNTALTQSPITNVIDSTDNTPSGNWQIFLSASLTGGGGSGDVLVQVTADSAGALGNGQNTKVLAELEMLSDDAYPYITVN